MMSLLNSQSSTYSDKYFNKPDLKMVAGIRKKRKDNIIKIITSKIANYVRNLVLKDNCRDTGCSLKIFDKNIFLSFPYFNGIHRFLPSLFVGYGYETAYAEVDHRPRIKGYSKYGTFDRLTNGLINLIRVKKILMNKK